MADIFISYAREDETRIRRLVDALEKQGWAIFWDRRIPAGKTWQSYIGQALSEAKCVIVAWSRHSILSEWVIEEANDGKKRGLLIPIFLDSVEPPLGFRGIQAADLTDWKPLSSSFTFDQLIQDIAAVVGGLPHRLTSEELVTPRTKPVATPRALPTEPAPHGPAPPMGRKTDKFLAGAVIALAIAIVAGSALWFLQKSRPPEMGSNESQVGKAPEARTESQEVSKSAVKPSEPRALLPEPVPRTPSSVRDALAAYKYNFGWSGGPQVGTETLSPVTMVTFAPDGRVVLQYARPGTIVASLDERKLSGTWKDSDGEGELELRFTTDFSHADGWWRFKGQEQKYPALMKRFE